MSEQLWHKCPICMVLFCHHAKGYPSGMVPLPSSALVIEDGQAALAGVRAELRRWLDTDPAFSVAAMREEAKRLLRAAVGKGSAHTLGANSGQGEEPTSGFHHDGETGPNSETASEGER